MLNGNIGSVEPTTAANRAGYANVAQPGMPPIPWYYRTQVAPANIPSFIPPVLYSYLPPVWQLHT